ncbi:MAG: pseudouridine-5'-phosphate glycosidase [Bacillota bacterium]|nr:pseudouridine-5'-phosphate glycosidase [Bacillota bacterium]
MGSNLKISDEVAAALPEGRVVALESSIICQGMPWPQNIETALAAEEAIRREGAVPATIAVADGEVRVGLSPSELEQLAKRKDAVKAGIRDLPWAELKSLTAGTTVSATMAIADAAGIRVFATGGIGGVHPGEAMDISMDLVALSRLNVIVVCSGAKSFLDIGNTLEVLETLSVPVIGYQTDDFPGFFVRSTGFRVPYRLDSVDEIVRFAQIKWSRGLTGGILVTNPVPSHAATDDKVISQAIEYAQRTADEQGIKGKAVTPFILEQIRRFTNGQSLSANVALAVNNAKLAGQIASQAGLLVSILRR